MDIGLQHAKHSGASSSFRPVHSAQIHGYGAAEAESPAVGPVEGPAKEAAKVSAKAPTMCPAEATAEGHAEGHAKGRSEGRAEGRAEDEGDNRPWRVSIDAGIAGIGEWRSPASPSSVIARASSNLGRVYRDGVYDRLVKPRIYYIKPWEGVPR